MATILLFHHVQGLTPGVLAMAETLRGAGHVVHTPDLLDGQRFDSIDAGVAHVRSIGFDTVLARGQAAGAAVPKANVFIGLSLGAIPAQALAQTRPGARGAVLLHSAVPAQEFSPRWPAKVAVQIHGMDADPEFIASGDIEAARAIVAQARDGALFLYPGAAHLFTDASLPDHDPEAAALVMERMLAFLEPF